MKPSMTAVRNAIDKSLAERDQNVERFCSSLDKDIVELGKEVKSVKQEAQVMKKFCHYIIVLSPSPCVQ